MCYRDIILTPSPSYRSTPKPHPVVNKLQAHMAMASRPKAPFIAVPSNIEGLSMPSQLISSYANFGPSSHIIRDHNSRIPVNFLGFQGDKSPASNSYAGHLTATGHFVGNINQPNALRYPQNSISSAFSHQQQQQTQLRQQQYQQQQQHIQAQKQQDQIQQVKEQEQHEQLQQQQHIHNQRVLEQQQLKEQEQQHHEQLQQQHIQNQRLLEQHKQLKEQDQQNKLLQQQAQYQHQYYQQSPHQHHTEVLSSDTRPVYEPIQNVEIYKDFSKIKNSQSENGPGPYLPPLPSVPPSVLSPFFQQIQQQQQHHTQPEQYSSSSPSSTTVPRLNHENYNHTFSNSYDTYKQNLESQFPDFKALEDEFSSNLVPPPYKHRDTSQFRDRPVSSSASSFQEKDQFKALEILNKYNIPALSPLQDANRFAYNSNSESFPSPSPSPSEVPRITEAVYATSFTTEKPNIFRNLNRPSESEYKEHKLMHPAYTGGLKRPTEFLSTHEPFLPTPHGRDSSAYTHSFFTIEDAVTLSPKHHYRLPIPTNTNQIEDIIGKPQEEEITEVITMQPPIRGSADDILQLEYTTVSSTLPAPVSPTRLRGRNKIRRRRPRPSTSTTENLMEIEDDESQGHWEKPVEIKTQPRKEVIERYPNHREQPVYKEQVPNNHRNSSRNGNRGRPPVNSVEESSSEKPSSRGRRPNHRTEENKTQRMSTTAKIATENPLANIQPTTIDFHENIFLSQFQSKSKRPSSTQQTYYSTPTFQSPTEIISTKLTTINHTPSAPTTSEWTDQTRVQPRRPSTTSQTDYNQSQESDHRVEPTIVLSKEFPTTDTTKSSVSNEVISTFDPDYAYTNSVEDVSTTKITSVSPLPTKSVVLEAKIASTVSKSDDVEPIVEDVTRYRQRLKHKLNTSRGSTSTTTPVYSSYSDTDIESTAKNNIDNDVSLSTSSQEIRKDVPLKIRLPITKDGASEPTSTQSSLQPTTNKSIRLNAFGKLDSKNRPRFSVKDYRQRLSTTTTTVKSTTVAEQESSTATTRLRYPTRNRLLPDLKNKASDGASKSEEVVIVMPNSYERSTENSLESNQVSSSTDGSRKRFSPKDRYSGRTKSTTESTPTSTTLNPTTSRATTRARTSSRQGFTTRGRSSTSPTTSTSIENSVTRVPTIRNSQNPLRRPPQLSLRQRVANQKSTTTTVSSELDETINSDNAEILFNENNSQSKADVSIEEESSEEQFITENYKRETAIMKIAKDDHSYRPYTRVTKSNEIDGGEDMNGSPSEQSERVAELTIFGSNHFNSVNTASGASRRVPVYFTIATEDPILPIEAFFPQVKKE